MARSLRAGVAIALLCAAVTARADPGPRAPELGPIPAKPAVHSWRMVGEAAAVIAVGTIWYWSRTNLQREDWELHWDWPSWEAKLTDPGRTIRFDTNGFSYNAINHPLAGALDYQIGRASGLGPFGATVLAFGAGAFWEYFVEFKEIPSLNDLIMNPATGIAIGEPLLQLGQLMRQDGDRDERGVRGLAVLVAPFDVLHDRLDGHAALGPPPWYRADLRIGTAAGWYGGPDYRPEGKLAIDIGLVRVPGFGEPGERRGALGVGAWSRIAAGLRVVPSDPEVGRIGTEFLTRTSLAGRYRRAVDLDDDDLDGTEVLAALATGFTYETRRLRDDEKDRWAIAHLVGVELGVTRHRGGATLTWEAGGFGDFSMIQAHAFGPVRPFHPSYPYANPLESRGYYFGAGATLESRVLLHAGPLAAEAELRGHLVRSIDGLDRHELGNGEDPHGITDQRLLGCLRLGWSSRDTLSLALVGEAAIRRGAWGDQQRTTWDRTLGLELGIAL